jgi:hypothetical protein
MRPNNAGPRVPEANPAWEAPTFTKVPIAARTRSPSNLPHATEPPAPGQPLSKLGFSFEMALPMSSRPEK